VTSSPQSAGRARLIPSQRTGMSAREEILDAAGALFAENGYAATSTRSIALAVGMKQASLYYHFASKEDILAGLLAGTIEPSLEFSGRISRSRLPAHVQLYALTHFDVSLLATGRTNVGALYQLAELRGDRFAEFRRDRRRLRDAYGRRVVAGVRSGVFEQNSSLRLATDLVFAMAESVIGLRGTGEVRPAEIAPAIAEGCLRLLSCSDANLLAAVSAAKPLLAQAG
jgi:AcrR family transcriptional regulator